MTRVSILGWVYVNNRLKYLKLAGGDIQVRASFYGQLTREPYTAYSGELGGVNGKLLRITGSFEP